MYTLGGTDADISTGDFDTNNSRQLTIMAKDNDMDAADKEVMVSAKADNLWGVVNPEILPWSVQILQVNS